MNIGKCLEFNFERGMILRADTLNLQNSDLMTFRKYLYSDYPDGIVSGFSLHKDENVGHFFSPGLLLLDGNIYMLDRLTEDDIFNMPDTESDTDYFLCLRKSVTNHEICETETETTDDFEKFYRECKGNEKKPCTEKKIELSAVKKSERCTGDIIIASFRLTAGKVKFSQKLSDYGKSAYFSTFEADYSVPGGKALSPDFKETIREYIKNKSDKDYLDMQFYMYCLQNEYVSRDMLLFYCSCKLDKEMMWDGLLPDNLQLALDKNINPVSVQANENLKSPQDDENCKFDYEADGF